MIVTIYRHATQPVINRNIAYIVHERDDDDECRVYGMSPDEHPRGGGRKIAPLPWSMRQVKQLVESGHWTETATEIVAVQQAVSDEPPPGSDKPDTSYGVEAW